MMGIKWAFEIVKNLLMVLGLGTLMYAAWNAVQDKLECWGAPKVVEFHQGMTICPGQSARLHIEIPLHPGPEQLFPTAPERAL